MPFVTAGAAPEAAPELSLEAALGALASPDAATRRLAARALAGNAEAKKPLAERLCFEPDANVRAALFASLAAMRTPEIPSLIASFLSSAEPGLRCAAADALKQMQAGAAPAIDTLLGDPDADLRLLAIEVTRAWPPALARPRLRRVIEADPHINVCAGAVDIAAELGGPELLGPLLALRRRFPHHPFIHFAAEIARDAIAAAGARGA